MAKKVAIGLQNFETLRTRNCFYVDKTHMIKEWWENEDDVTLITRPRRFGKTLNMSMLECFFSLEYAGRGEELFGDLFIWQEEKYRKLQGSYPVINLSFASIKENTLEDTLRRIGKTLSDLFGKQQNLLQSNRLSVEEKNYIQQMINKKYEISQEESITAIQVLSELLQKEYGKKVLILLDEYDTPMHEAYVGGYWNELITFLRNLFHATFKSNLYLEQAIMTGITRISKESIFSDLNHLNVVTTTSEEYADCFGFTEEEVFDSLEEMGLSAKKEEVKQWYDGFTFGNLRDIYNPWSIINFLRNKGKFGCYWANTSSNNLVDKLVREGNSEIKEATEDLLSGKVITVSMDEQVVFDQLNTNVLAVWSLFLASGYLKVVDCELDSDYTEEKYRLELTNEEVKRMFRSMVRKWFSKAGKMYNEFVKSMLVGNVKDMNSYMNEIALSTFSFFDFGQNPSTRKEPERFYHGFVLRLLVDLRGQYVVSSNRESGFGRYDVVLEPLKDEDFAVIIEFKVHDPESEKDMQETVDVALKQIVEKQYETMLVEKGISKERIHRYGFAFKGKKVLIAGK